MTEETIEELFERHEKEMKELSSTDEPTHTKSPAEKQGDNGDVDTKPEISKDVSEDWKEGYIEYEIKPKNVKEGRVQFEENEIEVTEEDIEDGSKKV